MGMRDAYLLSFKARVQAWEAEIDRLERHTTTLAEGRGLRVQERVLALRRQVRELKRRARQLMEARGTAFEDLKHETERQAKAIQDALDAARAELF